MEAHRNTWLVLVTVFSAVGSVFLAWALTSKGAFWGQSGTPYVFGLFGGAVVFFVLALRQVRVPLLRGSEAALLHRKLRTLHAEIVATPNPAATDVQKIADEAMSCYWKYAPHRMGEVQGAKNRGDGQAPRDALEYLRQGIVATMTDLEKGGSV